ncbi:hypothetical protein ABZ920_09295 [Streptomyces sp. NPDC046831]|uniref:hypothetical protein n=1 Tax=Streptomyces sp. NPDC046831 TaxID=3154805 RepID=UPI0033C93E11
MGTDMGERQGDGGAGGRRRVHPAGTVPGPEHAPDGAALQAMLATALRGGALDAEAEQRAVAAFRAARTTAGARGTRTRSGDDWRPRGHGRARLPVKALLGVFAASLTLGGVAVAAIGTAGSSGRGPEDGRPHRSSDAPADPSAAAPRTGVSTAPATPDQPAAAAPAADAHCRAYEQVRGRGQALDARAWRWLVAAAGGEENVARYCAERTGGTPAAKGSNGAGGTGRPAAPGGSAAASPAAPGGAADPGNAASGGGAGGGTDGTNGTTGRGNDADAGTGQDANGGSAGTGQDPNDKAGAQH